MITTLPSKEVVFPTDNREETARIARWAWGSINPVSQLAYLQENLFSFLGEEFLDSPLSDEAKDEIFDRLEQIEKIWPSIIEVSEHCPIHAAYHLGNTEFPTCKKRKKRASMDIPWFYQGRSYDTALSDILEEIFAYLTYSLIKNKDKANACKVRVIKLWAFLFADITLELAGLHVLSPKLRKELGHDFF